ncbi:MAG TPA: carboxylesterase family protein, partial [Opitutaceae bacterium]
MNKPLLLAVFAALLSINCRAAEASATPSPVTVANGVLQGGLTADGVRYFYGIPYALPPVSEFRWKEPQPTANWEGVRMATQFGPRPEQPPKNWRDMITRAPSMGEDSLYLNVWTAADSATAGQPVLVYFHGGGLTAGD